MTGQFNPEIDPSTITLVDSLFMTHGDVQGQELSYFSENTSFVHKERKHRKEMREAQGIFFFAWVERLGPLPKLLLLFRVLWSIASCTRTGVSNDVWTSNI